MPWTDFEKKIKNTRFEFTEEQLKNLKIASANMYEILKYVFDAPRRLYKPYNSLEDYKVKKERLYTSPSDFYSFRYDNVLIQIHYRFNRFYSVGVFGYQFGFDNLEDDLPVSEKMRFEKVFSNGFYYYGSFSRNEFSKCVDMFENLISRYMREIHKELPF